MKILCVHPGASMSTHDVWVGISNALRGRRHEVFDYALDARIERAGAWLSYCWKRGGKSTPKPSPSDILYLAGEELVTRALRVEPDVVLIVSGMFLHPDVFVLLRRAGLKTALMLTESPYDDDRQVRVLPWVDVAWSNERSSAKAMGVFYLPSAWNSDVHWPGGPLDHSVASHDVVFVGTGFEERIDLLAAIDWTGIDLGLYGGWEMLGSRASLRQYLRGSYIDNPVATSLYRRAKIGLNLYRTSMGFGRGTDKTDMAESLNPRAYELAATGCFTISDPRPEVSEIFGDLVPTFTSPETLREQIVKWLADDEGRTKIQAQLPGTVSAHTWTARAAQVESELYAAGIGAPRTQPHAVESLAPTAGG